jgi:putative tricarboxylic transport membrane protein
MESLGLLIDGFGIALQWQNVMWAFVGVLLGTAVGILPGIGPALTVALLLPVTYNLNPVSAFIMFAGIYYGGMYGGSTTSILLNTPGESGSIITALEGNKMARSGRATAALATAAIGSFVAGTLGTIALTFAAPALADMALVFGPAEYFALIVVGFTTISSVLGKTPSRGLLSLFLGLALGIVGIDLQTGQARFTLGLLPLLDGIHVVVVAVGLFAVGETLYLASQSKGAGDIIHVKGWTWLSKEDLSRSWKPWIRGAFLGFPIGGLPTGGAEIPTFLSYAIEKRLSNKPEEFGHGAIEGVAGPEAANNAAAAGVLVPLLTLGLPTSATAAIMLAAFQQFNLQPGPLIFINNPELVWGLIASLYIGNTMLLLLNLPLAPLWARLLKIPTPFLYSGILVFATLGTYSLNNSVFDVGLMYLIGALGFCMRLVDVPVAPAVIGMILGPMAEQQFRRALAISQGDPAIFFTRPISATLLGLAIFALISVPLYRYWEPKKI